MQNIFIALKLASKNVLKKKKKAVILYTSVGKISNTGLSFYFFFLFFFPLNKTKQNMEGGKTPSHKQEIR